MIALYTMKPEIFLYILDNNKKMLKKSNFVNFFGKGGNILSLITLQHRCDTEYYAFVHLIVICTNTLRKDK